MPQPLEWIIAEALTKKIERNAAGQPRAAGQVKKVEAADRVGTLPTSPSELNRSTCPNASIAPSISIAAKQSTVHEAARTTVPTEAIPTTTSHRTIAKQDRRCRYRARIARCQRRRIFSVQVLHSTQTVWSSTIDGTNNRREGHGEDINGQVTISPDGKYVVCAANDLKQQASLWIRQISTNSLVRLVPPETGGYLGTTFLPDGELIYYVATLERNKFVPTLYRIPVLGGTPTKVLDRVFGPVAFSRDGQRFAFVRRNQNDMSLMVTNTDGTGEPKTIAVAKPPNGFSVSGPSWSSDGDRIALVCRLEVVADTRLSLKFQTAGGDPKAIGSRNGPVSVACSGFQMRVA